MRPRLEWLETFLAIADSGSLTRAGERLARSQSAVSLQLRKLEEVIGQSLFERDTRRIRITRAGERLIPEARRALAAADAVVNAVSLPVQTLRIGVLDEYADRLIPRLLDEAARENAALTFEVECSVSAELERRVSAGDLDVAFVLSDEIAGTGEAVFSEPVDWVQAPGAELIRRRPLPVALFDRECSWRNRAVAALEAASIDHRVVFTSPSVAGVRAGIRAGLAVGVLARSTAGQDLEPIHGSDAPPALPPVQVVAVPPGRWHAQLARASHTRPPR